MSVSMLPSLLAFLAILVMIPGALWLLKRSQSLRAGPSNALSVVAAVGVGARERIAVVRADDRYLVVGITSQSISLLSQLDDWPADAGSATPLPAFASLLKRAGQPGKTE